PQPGSHPQPRHTLLPPSFRHGVHGRDSPVNAHTPFRGSPHRLKPNTGYADNTRMLPLIVGRHHVVDGGAAGGGGRGTATPHEVYPMRTQTVGPFVQPQRNDRYPPTGGMRKDPVAAEEGGAGVSMLVLPAINTSPQQQGVLPVHDAGRSGYEGPHFPPMTSQTLLTTQQQQPVEPHGEATYHHTTAPTPTLPPTPSTYPSSSRKYSLVAGEDMQPASSVPLQVAASAEPWSMPSAGSLVLPPLPDKKSRQRRRPVVVDAAVRLGGLGPDKDNAEYAAKMEKYRKQKEYAERIRSMALTTPRRASSVGGGRPASSVATSTGRRNPSVTPHETEKSVRDLAFVGLSVQKVDEAAAKREKMKLYAANIKRPTTFLPDSPLAKNTPSRLPALPSGKTRGSTAVLGAAAAAAEDGDTLRKLEEEHARGVQVVASIRRELGRDRYEKILAHIDARIAAEAEHSRNLFEKLQDAVVFYEARQEEQVLACAGMIGNADIAAKAEPLTGDESPASPAGPSMVSRETQSSAETEAEVTVTNWHSGEEMNGVRDGTSADSEDDLNHHDHLGQKDDQPTSSASSSGIPSVRVHSFSFRKSASAPNRRSRDPIRSSSSSSSAARRTASGSPTPASPTQRPDVEAAAAAVAAQKERCDELRRQCGAVEQSLQRLDARRRWTRLHFQHDLNHLDVLERALSTTTRNFENHQRRDVDAVIASLDSGGLGAALEVDHFELDDDAYERMTEELAVNGTSPPATNGYVKVKRGVKRKWEGVVEAESE
ncbi:hypothetical protein HK104_004194, partial [Borealophlyctis nickersoniae]